MQRKLRLFCNVEGKNEEKCLNDKLIAGAELLQKLNGKMIRFFEGLISLSVDIESIFLQGQVPVHGGFCLTFLWRPRTNESVKSYGYQRHVFEAKRSSF